MARISATLWWFSYILLILLLGKARFRLRWEGDANSATPPALLLGKHCSYWDIPLISTGVKKWYRTIPFFEMGSFHGYAVLGKVRWILKLWGGFEVMRSKDLLRLKHITKKSRAELREVMNEVNAAAAKKRAAIFRSHQTMCFFPEGARDKEAVARLRSTYEVAEAIEQAKQENLAIQIRPVVPCYGPKPKFFIPYICRREVVIRLLDPIDFEGRSAEEVLDSARQAMEAHWTPDGTPIKTS